MKHASVKIPRLIRDLSFLALAGVMLFCSKPERPSRDECVRGFRNFVRLMTKDNPAQAAFLKKTESVMVRKMAGKCMKDRKRPVVLCEIAATSLSDLKACRKK